MHAPVRVVRCWMLVGCLALFGVAATAAFAEPIVQGAPLELVASFTGPMPVGVAISSRGRLFVSFPRWGDPVEYTVAEVQNGSTFVPYPNAAINRFNEANPAASLVSVQALLIDGNDRLWMLDPGSINFGPTYGGGPKLVGVDLATNTVVKTILFPPEVALPHSYLNDLRIDLRRGTGGVAYITDSSDLGPNGIVVVDLASGQSYRRLNGHPTTAAERDFLPYVDGEPLLLRPPTEPPRAITTGADGIAISVDGSRLLYHALAGRRLYSVSTDALLNRGLSDVDVAATIIDHGDVGSSDGMITDSANRVYTTNPEHNAIIRHPLDGNAELVSQDPQLLWPDSMAISSDQYLYVTANQLNRQSKYHNGTDLRQKPYSLFRIKIDAGPVVLK